MLLSLPPMYYSKSWYASWFPRIGLGVAIAGYGVNHLRFIGDFVAFAQSPYPSIPVLTQLVGLLAYVFPLLMIVGGVLFAVGQLKRVSKFCILASLGGIIGWGGLGVMVGGPAAGGQMMEGIQNAIGFLLAYYVVKKLSCCGCKSGSGSGCGCGAGSQCGSGTGSSSTVS